MSRITEEWRRKNQVYNVLEDLAFEMNFTIDAVIVEGPHDETALRKLGFKRPIIKCSTPRLSHFEIAEYVAKKFSRIVILTDFDDEGKNINKKLLGHLERMEVTIDEYYRRRFGRLLGEVGILTLESLYRIKKELFP